MGAGQKRSGRLGSRLLIVTAGAFIAALVAAPALPNSESPAAAATVSPIKHVVIIDQENHSFDNVLGLVCKTRTIRCNGVSTGKIGSTSVPLKKATDIVPNVGHTALDQTAAMNGGLMDHFDLAQNCGAASAYACYSQYQAAQIPNVAAFATKYAVSDRTFSQGPYASSMQHLILLSGGTTDGFVPDLTKGPTTGPGWGCDSGLRNMWKAPDGSKSFQPLCIPAQAGSVAATKEPDAVKASPVPWIPTILGRLGAAGKGYRIYAAPSTQPEYLWSTCPLFAACLYGTPPGTIRRPLDILTDAAAGTLPSFSLLLPDAGVSGDTSQHNFTSMIRGDNWLGTVMNALQRSPQWSSTAVFLTWDDCGCFYDHVAPPAGSGLDVRVPMIIMSPYTKAGYTDSSAASFESMIAFTEHTFGLAPLTAIDGAAYDYRNSFDYTQTPLTPVATVTTPVPLASTAFLSAHPMVPDAT